MMALFGPQGTSGNISLGLGLGKNRANKQDPQANRTEALPREDLV